MSSSLLLHFLNRNSKTSCESYLSLHRRNWPTNCIRFWLIQKTMLKTTKLVMIWLSMIPANYSEKIPKRKAYFVVTLIALSEAICVALSSFVFVWKFLSIDLESSLISCISLFGGMNIFFICVTSFCMRQKLCAIFEKLSTIRDESK